MAAGILSWDLFSTCTREASDELRQVLRELRGLKAAWQKDRREVRSLTGATRALLKVARSNRQVDMGRKANSKGRSITSSTRSDGCTPEPISPLSTDVEPDCEQSPKRHRSPPEAGAGMSSFSWSWFSLRRCAVPQAFRVSESKGVSLVLRPLLLFVQF